VLRRGSWVLGSMFWDGSIACEIDGDDAEDADADEGRAREPDRIVESNVGVDDEGIVPRVGSGNEAVEDEGQGERH
jgi:hypothetical protein